MFEGQAVIELFNVSKFYPGGQVGLKDVSLSIPKGQLVFLTGASGAGKSTFLKLIYCEELPSEGNILVNGRNVSSLPRNKIPYLRRTIGVVFQNFRLIPRKTVFENVAYLPPHPRAGLEEPEEAGLRDLASSRAGPPNQCVSASALWR